MPISIAPYSEGHIPAVKDFNHRLREGGAPADYVFSESNIPAWLPKNENSPIFNEFFVVLEGEAVRGAFVLKHQTFSFRGSLRRLVYLHHPFSEGIIDKRYSQVGAQMLKRIIRENPMLFALGMGGYDRPLPRMLLALRWNHCLIPFYFRICNGAKFLREMQVLRTSAAKRIGSGLAATTGLGPLAITSWQAVHTSYKLQKDYRTEVVDEFDDWTNAIWAEVHEQFAMTAVRDCESLRTLYPPANRKVTRIRIMKAGAAVGWAVTGILHRPGHEQYGDLRVGTVLDVLSKSEHAAAVIAAATGVLIEQGAELISSNQSHEAWTSALAACGFLKGPSNFIFAAAPQVSGLLEPFGDAMRRAHLNRGDGDNLLQYC